MLLSPAMLPRLNAVFRNGNAAMLEAESDQSPTTSGVFHLYIAFSNLLKISDFYFLIKISCKSQNLHKLLNYGTLEKGFRVIVDFRFAFTFSSVFSHSSVIYFRPLAKSNCRGLQICKNFFCIYGAIEFSSFFFRCHPSTDSI